MRRASDCIYLPPREHNATSMNRSNASSIHEGSWSTNSTHPPSTPTALPQEHMSGTLAVVFFFMALMIVLILVAFASRRCNAVERTAEKEQNEQEMRENIRKNVILRQYKEHGESTVPMASNEECDQVPALTPDGPGNCDCSLSVPESSDGNDAETEQTGSKECAICLSAFEEGDLVCESRNVACRHVFHQTCMEEWLVKYHDRCPVCRRFYLQASP